MLHLVKTKVANTKLFNKINYSLFAVLFASIGGYFIIHSFAATDITQLNGLLGTDTSYFPISVWLQTPNNTTTINGQSMTVAQAYSNAGINLMNNGGYAITNTFMQAVQNAGQGVISSNQSSGLSSTYKGLIKAWGQVDEPDNAQSNGSGGYDPCINPATIVSNYSSLKTADSTRPVVINYGKGVADTTWGGRGTCTGLTDMYKLSWNGGTGYAAGPAYSAGADIVSYDVYPVNDGYPLTKVADGVDNLRNWTGDTKPVWAFLEVTKFDTANGAPTPAQVRAETWLALTHGARGLQYFSHIFTPTFVEAGLLNDQTMYNSVKTNNLQIKSLAPQLNSPTIANGATVSSSLRIDKIVKQTGSDTYVFAVTPGTASGNATFTIPGASNGIVTVIDENRTLNMTNGSFTDNFAGLAVHLYKISPASTGPTANLWVDGNGGTCQRSSTQIEYSPNGDSNSCSSFDAAYKAASPGDTVLVKSKSGGYGAQTISTDSSKISATSPVIIKAANGESVTVGLLSAGKPDRTTGGPAYWVEFADMTVSGESVSSGSHHITFRNITSGFVGVWDASFISWIGGDITGAVDDKAMYLIADANGTGTTQPHDILIDGVTIHDAPRNPPNHAECLAIWGFYNVVVRNSKFYHCAVYDISATETNFNGSWYFHDAIIENNFFDTAYNTITGSNDTGDADLFFESKLAGSKLENILVRNNSFAGSSGKPLIFSTWGNPANNLYVVGNTGGGGDSARTCKTFAGGNGSTGPANFTINAYNVFAGIDCDGAGTSNTQYPVAFTSVDPAATKGSDLHLISTSNAIATSSWSVPSGYCPNNSSFGSVTISGKAIPALGSDIDGDTRPQGSGCDAGADEYQSGTTPTCTKQADINCDNNVNVTDLSIFLSNYGKTTAQLASSTPSYPRADINSSGKVDIGDLSTLLTGYGK